MKYISKYICTYVCIYAYFVGFFILGLHTSLQKKFLSLNTYDKEYNIDNNKYIHVY